MGKKLVRIPKEKIVAGIIAGLADYFNIDRTLLRLIFIFIVLITGFFPMVLLYIIAYFIMPVSDDADSSNFIK